jgi:hypothetical protein
MNILNGVQIYALHLKSNQLDTKCLGSLDLDELVDDLIAVLGSAVEELRGGYMDMDHCWQQKKKHGRDHFIY